MDHKRRALAVTLGTLMLTLGVQGAAQATIVPTLGSVTPSGGNFVWNYDVFLALDQNATGGSSQSVNPVPTNASVGDFLTIYDFRGFVSGSCFSPSGWTCQTQGTGFTPNTQTPADNAGITNLTFTRTGSTVNGPADLGDFGAQSIIGLVDSGVFTSRGTRNSGPLAGTKIDSVGEVSAPAAVPEPATLILLGSTMAGLGVTFRRRRRAGV
jgi:hypothetical protein